MKAKTRFTNTHPHKGRSPDGRGNNNAKQFVVVRDPQDIFSQGAVFGILDIQWGVLQHVFVDGTTFDTQDGRLRMDRGRLVYARNRATYPMAMPHV